MERLLIREGSVLLTGASSGIGLAIARRLAERNSHLVCLGRRAPDIGGAQGRVEHVKIDLADRRATLEVASQLANHSFEGVVHAAGLGVFGSVEQLSPQQIFDQLEVNLVAPMLITRAVLPEMKRVGGGSIVFVGSESALRGGPQGAAYSASKFGLRGFAEALRAEATRGGVRVSSVHPGMVRTPFFDQLGFEPGPETQHALEPEDVAEVVISVLDLPPHVVVDAVELTPLHRVVRKKKSSA